MSDRPKEAG